MTPEELAELLTSLRDGQVAHTAAITAQTTAMQANWKKTRRDTDSDELIEARRVIEELRAQLELADVQSQRVTEARRDMKSRADELVARVEELEARNASLLQSLRGPA